MITACPNRRIFCQKSVFESQSEKVFDWQDLKMNNDYQQNYFKTQPPDGKNVFTLARSSSISRSNTVAFDLRSENEYN